MVEEGRDDVEGDEALGIAARGIDGEGDADAAEEQLRLAPLEGDELGRCLVEPAADQPILSAQIARLARLVERAAHTLPCRRLRHLPHTPEDRTPTLALVQVARHTLVPPLAGPGYGSSLKIAAPLA